MATHDTVASHPHRHHRSPIPVTPRSPLSGGGNNASTNQTGIVDAAKLLSLLLDSCFHAGM